MKMKRHPHFLALVLTLLSSLSPFAADSPIRHRLLFFEYGKGPNRLLELDDSGKVIWDHKPPSIAVIFQVLPNGNTLISCGTQKRVIEVTPDKKIA